MTLTAVLPEACLHQLTSWVSCEERKILGIVAPPGAGKSTFAEAIHRVFPSQSQIVPMDGFHLANVELARLGRANRKGAADTFDALGFLNLLHRIQAQTPEEIIYAPDFRRDLEEAVAGSIAVLASTPLIIVEGNYLLGDDGPWASIRGVLDEVWYLSVNEVTRHDRLLHRHLRFGRTRQDALVWMASTDEPNARLIETTRHRADRHIDWNEAD
jgi:pantothenate kinase